jgi:hypothetical protein
LGLFVQFLSGNPAVALVLLPKTATGPKARTSPAGLITES